MNYQLSIVVPCFNKYNFTKSCLQDLFQLPNDIHEIVIVDNGSTDETQQELQQISHQSNFKYIRNNVNVGFAGACNIGYAAASAPNVLFLNNDIRVKEYTNWTQGLIMGCSTSLVGPTMGQLDSQFNFIREANLELNGQNTYMSGWCLASSKKIFDKLRIKNYIGPFSEEFGLAYHEDTDLSFRARLLDIPFQVVKLPVVHFGKISSQQLNTRDLYLKSRKIFINKWSKK